MPFRKGQRMWSYVAVWNKRRAEEYRDLNRFSVLLAYSNHLLPLLLLEVLCQQTGSRSFASSVLPAFHVRQAVCWAGTFSSFEGVRVKSPSPLHHLSLFIQANPRLLFVPVRIVLCATRCVALRLRWEAGELQMAAW